MPSSWGSSQSRDRTWVCHTADRFFTIWTTWGGCYAPLWNKPPWRNWLHLLSPTALLLFSLESTPVMPSPPSHVSLFSKPQVISVLLNLVVNSVSSSYLANSQLFVYLTNFLLAIFPTLDFQYATLFWISFFLPGYCFSVSSASWFFFSLPIS